MKNKEKIHFEEFTVQKRKIILCFRSLITDTTTNIFVGMSVCNPEDKFNKIIGEKIAKNRAISNNINISWINLGSSGTQNLFHNINYNPYNKSKIKRKFNIREFSFSNNIPKKLILDFAISSVKENIIKTPENYIKSLKK